MSSNPRAKMIRSAALLISQRGVEGTSFSDVLALSGAPRGSIYHYFPGGKTQLVEEAACYAGDAMAAELVACLEHDDPLEVVKAFAAFYRPALHETDYALGCPIVASALEASSALP